MDVAPTAIMPPPIRLQLTARGSRSENNIQDAGKAKIRIIQASIMRKNTIEPSAAERRIRKLMRARWAA